jgi:hypothetical protein
MFGDVCQRNVDPKSTSWRKIRGTGWDMISRKFYMICSMGNIYTSDMVLFFKKNKEEKKQRFSPLYIVIFI